MDKYRTRLETSVPAHAEPWYISKHCHGLHHLRWPEHPVVQAIRSWLDYADGHANRYESGIGEDGVIGESWADWGMALRGLLIAGIGDLDAGTLDAVLVDTLRDEGFDPDTR